MQARRCTAHPVTYPEQLVFVSQLDYWRDNFGSILIRREASLSVLCSKPRKVTAATGGVDEPPHCEQKREDLTVAIALNACISIGGEVYRPRHGLCNDDRRELQHEA